MLDRTSQLNEKRPLTERERQAAANLRQIWERQKVGGRKLVQKEAAAAMDVQQSMISHYLNGITPLGTEAIMKWAMYLRVRPTDIDAEFEFKALAPGPLPAEAVEVAIGWLALPGQIQVTVKDLIFSAGK